MTASLEAIARLLRTEAGLDPETLGPRAVADAVDARRAALGLTSRASYLARLLSTPAERLALLDAVVVGETWFFREGAAFALLAERALALWSTRGGTFRVLSIPCATGEEPYSIAMTLLDAGLPPEAFLVDGIDISAALLATAGAARYGPRSVRGTALPPRHVVPLPDGRFELAPHVKASVRFRRGNVADADLLAGERPFDAVFCRNLLIYLTPEARARAFSSLARLLGPGALLFAGHAEALSVHDPRFRPSGPGEAFAFRIGGEREAVEPAAVAPAPRPLRTSRPRRVPEPARLEAPPAEPSRLTEVSRLADAGRLDEAVELAQDEVTARPEAHGYFLLGVIRRARGEDGLAEEAFRRVLFLDERHRDALLHLALLAESRGDAARAAGFRRRARAEAG